MTESISKVQILIQQQKFTAAEQILKDLLTQEAGNIHLLSLLAEVNLQQDKSDVAKRIIDNAIGLSPDSPQLFYIRSRIAIQQENYDEAENNLQQSIGLNPYEANYFALLASIKLIRKHYDEALDLANKSLEIDAENLLGLNTRSTALLKLNKGEESFDTIEGALRQDPNNAYTHANYGWGLLEKGEHKKALKHFKESLKQNPNSEYAQSGMMEALKAGNPVYRMFLKYSFWIGNLTSKYQWGVIIGFYVAMRVLKTLAQKNEALQPFLVPLIILLALLAFSTWVIKPISDLFLRFNTYGKVLLDKKQKMSSNFVAASFAVFVAGLLLFFILRHEKFLTIAVFGFAMMLPFSVMFSPSKYKYSLLIYTTAMAVIGLFAIAHALSTSEIFNVMTFIFVIGFVAFQWIANYLMIKESNR
jgi:tetratricopeptide (TPR) repeat protein